MRIDIDDWDDIVRALYETIVRPTDLNRVITQANDLLQSDLCHLFGIDRAGHETFRMISHKEYEPTVEAYSHHFGYIDPRREHLERAAPGGTYRCSEICNSAFVNRSEFYQDYYIPHGLRYVLGSCLVRDEHQSVYISFNHKMGREDFTDQEKKYFDRFIRHVGQVIKSMVAATPISDAIQAGEEYLYRYQHGVLGLTRDGRVSFVNKQAEDTLLTLQSQFTHSGLVAGSDLDAVFRAVLASGKPESCAIGHAAGTLYVTALPFRSDAKAEDESDLKLGGGTQVLVMCGGRHQRSHTVRQLMQWFRFTAAEARLARDLAAGGSVDDFATAYSVSVATVRTQLRGALQKSGTTRQQDLIRLLLTLPLSS